MNDVTGMNTYVFNRNCIEYLTERVRRAESRQIPNLKERVKELMRDAMDAARDSIDLPMSMESEFRALCAEVKP